MFQSKICVLSFFSSFFFENEGKEEDKRSELKGGSTEDESERLKADTLPFAYTLLPRSKGSRN